MSGLIGGFIFISLEGRRTKPQTRQLRAAYLSVPGYLGLLVQGTITKRVIPGLGGKSYGPYYQWTRKLNAKTVTVNLSRFQVKEFQTAIDNNRKLEETIQEMRKISLKICEATTVGVKKRNP